MRNFHYVVNGKLALSGGLKICNNISLIFLLPSGGNRFGAVMDNSNQLWTWGQNSYAELGINNTISKLTPVSIHGNKKRFTNLISGYQFMIGLGSNGQVWCWGRGVYGNLGQQSQANYCTPVSILGNKKTFCVIGGGYRQSLAIDHLGQVWGWGDNDSGQLGQTYPNGPWTPKSIDGTKKTFCTLAHAESRGSGGIDYNGMAWGWGSGNYGQLGNNTATTTQYTPVSVLGNKKTFCSISAGYGTTLAIDNHGQVWCWGRNFQGILGNGAEVSVCTPVSIHGAKKTFCAISGGMHHSMGLDKNGQVWSWGFGAYGSLGVIGGSICTPKSIHGVKKTFCSISTGDKTSLGVEYTGQVWGWGYNFYGNIGDGTKISRSTPVRVCL